LSNPLELADIASASYQQIKQEETKKSEEEGRCAVLKQQKKKKSIGGNREVPYDRRRYGMACIA
jgi:hypothetical protein